MHAHYVELCQLSIANFTTLVFFGTGVLEKHLIKHVSSVQVPWVPNLCGATSCGLSIVFG